MCHDILRLILSLVQGFKPHQLTLFETIRPNFGLIVDVLTGFGANSLSSSSLTVLSPSVIGTNFSAMIFALSQNLSVLPPYPISIDRMTYSSSLSFFSSSESGVILRAQITCISEQA